MVNNVSLDNISKIFEHNTISSVTKTAATEKNPPVVEKLEPFYKSVDFEQIKNADIPQVSQQKLDQITNAIANGQYRIDYTKLAEALLQQNVNLS